MTFIIKLVILFITLGTIFGYAVYTGLLTNLSTVINTLNSDFFAYLPIEMRVIFGIIVLAILIAIISMFID